MKKLEKMSKSRSREYAKRWVHDRLENKEPLWFSQYRSWIIELGWQGTCADRQKSFMQREYNRLKKIYKKKYGR